MEYLPLSFMECKKEYFEVYFANKLHMDSYDSFSNFYKIDEFSVMNETYPFEISHSVRYVLQ